MVLRLLMSWKKFFIQLEQESTKKKDNSIYQLKLEEEVSKNNGIIASVHLGILANNPFLADFESEDKY